MIDNTFEIEAKIKVDDIEHLRSRLIDVGAEYLAAVMQTDTYFDRPDGWLRDHDRGLRIRRTEFIDGPVEPDLRPELTCKGPRDPGGVYKTRREIQIRLDQADAFEGILSIAGMARCMTIQKRRSSYLLGPCRIELDELPMLGFFVEIEAPGEGEITSAIELLGLQNDTISETYVYLALSHCKEQGIEGKDISFE